MSGRRRRDDGWDDGRLDAQDDRRDPWADDSVGEWGGPDADPGDDADRSSAPSGGGAHASKRRGRELTCATRRLAARLTRPRAFPSFQTGSAAGNGSSSAGGYGSRGTAVATATGRFRSARRVERLRRGVRTRTPGTVPAATLTRALATDVTAAAVMAGMAGRATARAVKETTLATAAALATRVPMAGQAAPVYAPEFTPVDNDDADDEPRLARPGRTGGFRFTRCMRIRRGNSTGLRNGPRKVFARPSPTLLSTSST